MTSILLTEQEVADFLRCSRSKVKALRLTRKLSYLPGRPVFIDQADLLAYVEELKVRAVPKSRNELSEPPPEKLADIQSSARAAWIKHKLKQKRGPR